MSASSKRRKRAAHHYLEPLPGGRAREHVDYLGCDGSVLFSVALGSPAPITTVREAVARANGDRS